MSNKRLHYQVSEDCCKDIHLEDGSVGLKHLSGKKRDNTLFSVVETEGGDTLSCFMFPMEIKGKFYGLIYPDPVEMLIEQANMYCKMAYLFLPTTIYKTQNSFVKSSEGEQIAIVDEKLSKQLIAYKVTCVTTAIMALECCLNSAIPFDYKTIKNNREQTKADIERQYSIKEKFDEVKSIYNIEGNKFQDAVSNILRMVQLRHNFIHIKDRQQSEEVLSDGLLRSYEDIMNADLWAFLNDIYKVITTIKAMQ